jgi:hypothetical protein
MTVKKQQIEQEKLRATRPIMIRALSILAAVAALAVSAAPVASAGTSKKPPRSNDEPLESISFLKAVPPKAGPSKARVGGKMHLEDISLGVKHYDMSSPY